MGRATDGSSHSVFSVDVMDMFWMGVDSQNMWLWPFGFGPLQVKRYNRSLCLSVLCRACIAGIGSNKWKSRLYAFLFPMIPNFLVYFMQFLLIELRSRGPPSNQPHDPQSQTIFYFSHRTCMRLYFFFPCKSNFRWFAYKLLLGHSPSLFIFSGPYKSRKDAVSSVFALENQ